VKTRALLLVATIAALTGATAAGSAGQPPAPHLNGKIAFVIGGDYEQELYTMNPDASALRRLTLNDGVPDDHPVWSPDSRRLAWIHAEESLYVGDADGLHARAVGPAVEDTAPAWSPGGRYLYAIGQRASDNYRTDTVIRIDVQHDRATELTPAGDSDAYAFGQPYALASAPNGSLLVLTSISRCDGISNGVYTQCHAVLHVAADGTLLQALWLYTGLQNYDSASVAPNGDVFATDVPNRDEHDNFTNQSLRLFGLNGVTQLALTPLLPNTYDFEPAFSPDGRQLVFGRELEDDQLRSVAADLYVVPATGGNARPLTFTPAAFESAPSWQGQPTTLGHADLTPPVVHVRTQTVRAGQVARLTFRAVDAGTNRSRARGSIFDGKREVASWIGHTFSDASRGGVHLWQVRPRFAGKTLRYCVSASDWYGNVSKDSCTTLRIRSGA
jgi:WD40 repeat protein